MSANAGVVGVAELNTPNGTPSRKPTTPATWAWIWFGLACFIVFGFHIRIFGASFPPAAAFPA